MKFYLMVVPLILAGCNYMHTKPATMQRNSVIYTDRGGYTIQHHMKEMLEDRGYDVRVGKMRTAVGGGEIETTDGQTNIDLNFTTLPANTDYVIKVKESSGSFKPMWCFFNGFWWWRFNMSIVDNKSGEEIFAWTGRGCAHSTMRKLRRALDELEK